MVFTFVTNVLAKEGLIDIINDQCAALRKEEILYESNVMEVNCAQVAAKYGLGYIMMHMQGTPSDMQVNPQYFNCKEEVFSFFKERIYFAEEAGVSFVAIDPGIGFGKTLNHNLELLSKNFMQSILEFNKPILVGLSRKSFLGLLNPNLVDPQSRDKLTKNFEYNCISNGVKIIRTHVMPSEV